VERPSGPAARHGLGGGKATPFGATDEHDPERVGVLRPAPARALASGRRYWWRRSHAARASATSAVSRHCWTSSAERAYAVVKPVSKDDRASSLVARAAAWGTRL